MRPRRLILILLTAFLGAAGEPVALNPPVLPPAEPPFGLACSECSLSAESACSALWMSPVVADVRGAVVRGSNRQCYRVSREPGADSKETCDIVESVTFAQLHYFRAPPPSIADRFRVLHTTGDVPPEEAGIVFAPDRRYVVFAAPSDGALSVAAACPVEESRELQ